MVNKFVTAIFTIAATIGMVGLVQTSTVAAEVSDCNPQQIQKQNHECYWENKYGSGVECTKYDNLNSKTFVVPAAPEGTEYVAAIVKAGSDEANGGLATHQEVSPVSAGDVLTHATDKKISHVILCYADDDEEEEPGFTATLVCPVDTYTLTIANTGNTTLTVVINGTQTSLAEGADAIEADFEVGDTLTVTIDGQPLEVEGKVLTNFTLQTCQGMGGETPTTPGQPTGTTGQEPGAGAVTGDVVSLPVTSGASDQAAAIVVMIASMLATAGAYALRARTGLSI